MTPSSTPDARVPDLEIVEDGASGPRLVLAHGAGAPMDSEWMQDLTNRLVDRGIRVLRFEFPYMRRRRRDGGRRPPDRMPTLENCWRRVVERLGDPGHLVIGGKSMGGRVASRVADELGVAGLVCLGYPFHPPRRPERLRTAHLADLRTPTLILQGTRDRFGKPEEVAGYDLAASIRTAWIEDGDHSFMPRVRSERTPADNLDAVADAVATFVAHRPPAAD